MIHSYDHWPVIILWFTHWSMTTSHSTVLTVIFHSSWWSWSMYMGDNASPIINLISSRVFKHDLLSFGANLWGPNLHLCYSNNFLHLWIDIAEIYIQKYISFKLWKYILLDRWPWRECEGICENSFGRRSIKYPGTCTHQLQRRKHEGKWKSAKDLFFPA